MVVKPDALNPLICEADRPLALPMLPLQKIIAVVADTRCAPANIWSSASTTLANQNIFRGAKSRGMIDLIKQSLQSNFCRAPVHPRNQWRCITEIRDAGNKEPSLRTEACEASPVSVRTSSPCSGGRSRRPIDPNLKGCLHVKNFIPVWKLFRKKETWVTKCHIIN